VCIGALIDLNELECGRAASLAVRWSGEESHGSMVQVLAAHPDVSTWRRSSMRFSLLSGRHRLTYHA
jgi:hypothetical protein